MCKLPNLINKLNADTMAHYIKCGLQVYLANNSYCFRDQNLLFAEDHFNILNTIFLEAFLSLGELKSEFSLDKEIISSENAFRQ